MAFGEYAQLVSTFTGANEDPISEGGIWTNRYDGANNAMARTNNAMNSPSGTASAWYNARTYASDIELYATAEAKPAVDDWLRIFAHLLQPGTAGVDGYLVQIENLTGTDTISLFRVDNGTPNLLTSTGREWSSGARWGLESISSTIRVLINEGSGWSQVLTATDQSYRNGYVGLGAQQPTGRWDDFYAGNIVPVVVGQIPTEILGKGAA